MQLRLLGTFDVMLPDSEYSVPTAKSRLLLAWLILATQSSQPRKSLAARFWPDAEPDRAMHNLRMALSFLRPFAVPNEHGILDITAQTVQVIPTEQIDIDVWRVEQLLQYIDQHSHRHSLRCHVCMAWYEEIYALFRGPLLDGIEVDDAPDLALWLDMERERWAVIYHRVCWQLAQWYNMSARFEEAIVLVRRYLEQNLWHEEAQYLLMELNMRTGDRTRALHVAQSYEEMIKREFDAVPQPATQQLISRIRTHTWVVPEPMPRVAVPRVPFFGRRAEIRTLQRVISESRFQLFSIIGPGGCGKTLLSYHVAQACAGLFAHGTYFVALEHAQGEQDLLHALARAFRMQLHPTDELLSQLIDKLNSVDALVVLDNCEHLVEHADVLVQLINACPSLTLLVTSRLPFSVSYEYRMFLTGLPVHNDDANTSESAAVQLFLSRAVMYDPLRDWQRERASIIELCRMLDGLPLAIELAAGLSRSMPCARVVQLVSQRLDVLASDSRDVPARHRTLIAVFDEMWFKLSDLQRRVMNQMMVFQGGFDDDALRAVLSMYHDDATIDAVLRQLHDAGMVRFSQMRYEIHPILRQYVLAQYAHHEEKVLVAHMQYYLGLMCNPTLYHVSTQTVQLSQELAIEFDNVRAAWQYAIQQHELELVAQCVRAMHTLAICMGRVPEVADIFYESTRILNHAGVTDGRVMIQLALWECRLRHRLGAYQRMVEAATYVVTHADASMVNEVGMAHAMISVMESSQGQGIQALQRLNAIQPLIESNAHDVLADLYMRRGEALIFTQVESTDDATYNMEAALVHYQMIDDVIGIVNCHIWLAYRWVFIGEAEKTIELLKQTLVRAQPIGDRRVIGFLTAHIGSVQVFFGDRSPVHIGLIEEGLQHLRAISDQICELEVLHLLIYAHVECGHYDKAFYLLNANHSRIVRHGNAIQQLLFVDVCGQLCMALGHTAHAMTIGHYVITHPSVHARYRVLRTQALEPLQQSLSPQACKDAVLRAEGLQKLPLVDVIDQVFTIVSHLDIVSDYPIAQV